MINIRTLLLNPIFELPIIFLSAFMTLHQSKFSYYDDGNICIAFAGSIIFTFLVLVVIHCLNNNFNTFMLAIIGSPVIIVTWGMVSTIFYLEFTGTKSWPLSICKLALIFMFNIFSMAGIDPLILQQIDRIHTSRHFHYTEGFALICAIFMFFFTFGTFWHVNVSPPHLQLSTMMLGSYSTANVVYHACMFRSAVFMGPRRDRAQLGPNYHLEPENVEAH